MIVVDRVTKYFGSHCAVRDLSFKIAEGECVGFLGLNGAGKSTTLRLLACLLQPTSGRITVRGTDAEVDPHAIRRWIGYLPDVPPLYGDMTVREFLTFAAALRSVPRAERQARVDEALGHCHLQSVQGTAIGTLSHGFRQRVGIAQAIVHRPALVILDEPIQGLDPVQIVEMRELIRSLRGKHTILLSTHILSEIEKTCDRVLMLDRGTLAAAGTEEELAARIGAGRRVELAVRANVEQVRAALSALEGIEVVDVRSEAALTRVTLTNASERRGAIARAIVAAELDLLELRENTTELEEIFVGLSREERRS